MTAGPGPADPAQSTVAVAPASIAVSGTATVTLTARDSAGTALTTGGSTVTFGLGNGTAQGTFSAVTDNGDGTYTSTFTATVAGTNTITAAIDAQAVTSTAPTITVIGAADPAQSTVAVAPASIQSGGTATVTLTAKDANGTQLTTGGATVVFGLGNGTAQGTFSSVTDNGDGTYTATITGTTAGTNTITATIDSRGADVHRPDHYRGRGGRPGQSTVAVSAASIQSGGTATVTLTAKDANGAASSQPAARPLCSASVMVRLRGRLCAVTDNGDGTYTATFTGTTAGTNTITATIDSQALTSTAPTITVVGSADLARSTVSISPVSIPTSGTATVTLTAKDANGNQLTVGGSTVTFAVGNGSAQGTFTTVTDNGDGTYAATFTATVAGTNTITAMLDSQAVTSTAPTFTVT